MADEHTHATPPSGPPAAPPLTLTPKAADMIRQIRLDENVETEKVLRVGIRGGGCSGYQYDLSFDDPRPTDEEFVSEGVRMAVDPLSLQYLEGCTIDYESGLNGTGFKFINPNASRHCGCGESFST